MDQERQPHDGTDLACNYLGWSPPIGVYPSAGA